jgi:hypothetical protein
MSEQLNLDWSTAEVSDGKLTVGLSAGPSKAWRQVFERTATLLSAGTWDVALKPKKATVEIASVQDGDEERVRQFVEGAVLEANAKLADDQEAEDEAGDDEPSESHGDAAEPSPDERLSERFRAFAEPLDGAEG